MRAVYKALARGQWEALQEDPCLIQQLQESVGRKHEGPLEYMARRGYKQGLQFVLSHDQNHVNEALVQACENGHLECVRILVDRGAKASSWKNRAIMVAGRRNHVDIVKEFAPTEPQVRRSLVIAAVHHDHVALLTYLWTENIQPATIERLICSAAAGGRRQCLLFLLPKVVTSEAILKAAIRGRWRWVWDLIRKQYLIIPPSMMSSLKDTASKYRNGYVSADLVKLEREQGYALKRCETK